MANPHIHFEGRLVGDVLYENPYSLENLAAKYAIWDSGKSMLSEEIRRWKMSTSYKAIAYTKDDGKEVFQVIQESEFVSFLERVPAERITNMLDTEKPKDVRNIPDYVIRIWQNLPELDHITLNPEQIGRGSWNEDGLAVYSTSIIWINTRGNIADIINEMPALANVIKGNPNLQFRGHVYDQCHPLDYGLFQVDGFWIVDERRALKLKLSKEKRKATMERNEKKRPMYLHPFRSLLFAMAENIGQSVGGDRIVYKGKTRPGLTRIAKAYILLHKKKMLEPTREVLGNARSILEEWDKKLKVNNREYKPFKFLIRFLRTLTKAKTEELTNAPV